MACCRFLRKSYNVSTLFLISGSKFFIRCTISLVIFVFILVKKPMRLYCKCGQISSASVSTLKCFHLACCLYLLQRNKINLYVFLTFSTNSFAKLVRNKNLATIMCALMYVLQLSLNIFTARYFCSIQIHFWANFYLFNAQSYFFQRSFFLNLQISHFFA